MDKVKLKWMLFIGICSICCIMVVAVSFDNLKVLGVSLIIVVILNAILQLISNEF